MLLQISDINPYTKDDNKFEIWVCFQLHAALKVEQTDRRQADTFTVYSFRSERTVVWEKLISMLGLLSAKWLDNFILKLEGCGSSQ
jgi:hypothetical protein